MRIDRFTGIDVFNWIMLVSFFYNALYLIPIAWFVVLCAITIWGGFKGKYLYLGSKTFFPLFSISELAVAVYLFYNPVGWLAFLCFITILIMLWKGNN